MGKYSEWEKYQRAELLIQPKKIEILQKSDDSESSGVLNARHRNFVRHEANQAANIKLKPNIYTHSRHSRIYFFFISILKTRVFDDY